VLQLAACTGLVRLIEPDTQQLGSLDHRDRPANRLRRCILLSHRFARKVFAERARSLKVVWDNYAKPVDVGSPSNDIAGENVAGEQ